MQQPESNEDVKSPGPVYRLLQELLPSNKPHSNGLRNFEILWNLGFESCVHPSCFLQTELDLG